jgi:hypothetical protein
MSDHHEKDYEELIAKQLRDAGIKFATQKALAGLAPDFIVYAPDGRQFIVEVKNWDFAMIARVMLPAAAHCSRWSAR